MNKYLPGWPVFLFLLALLFPALCHNLGLVGISADEPTRANVAMEMMHSGNYVVSTIAGEYYYKKPPLFNWLLVALYRITGSKSEGITRLTAVIPLLLFALRIFWITRKHLSNHVALLAAFMFITFGRMLYYDSMLGHIDVLYGWVTFESFCLLYTYFGNGRSFLMFLGFYALHAIGFMLKGLPSVLFPFFTLVAMAIYQKKTRWLFNWQHAAGGLLAFMPVALFFYAYSLQNSLSGWVEQLWDQSRQRTVLDKTWWESIRHFFLFPVDHLMHLAPWSLLVIFVFRNRFMRTAKSNPFVRYLFWVLILNLPPYWASPGYYPRYLFMLYPIVFILLNYAYWESYERNNRDVKASLAVIRTLVIAVSVAFVAAIVYFAQPVISADFLLIFFLLMAILVWLFVQPQESTWLFVAFLLVTRLAFNLYVLPERAANGKTNQYKHHALEIAQLAGNDSLYITPYTPLGHDYIYYLERERNQPVHIKPADTVHLFIHSPEALKGAGYTSLKSFPVDYENRTLHLVRFTGRSAYPAE